MRFRTAIWNPIGGPIWGSFRPAITAVTAAVPTATTPTAASAPTSAFAVLRIATLRHCTDRCRRLSVALAFGVNGTLNRFRQQLGIRRVCYLSCAANAGVSVCPTRLLAQIRHGAARRNDVGQIVVVLFQLHEVGHVEDGVALKANVDKG